MPFKKTFIILFALVLAAGYTHAQVRKSVKSAKFRVPTVSRSKMRIMCPIFETSAYPYQGIGVKMGDPFALTYKFYPNKNWSFTADAGKAASGLYNKYYRDLYNTYLPDTLGDDKRITYLAHKATTDWFFQAKFLYQWNMDKVSEGLQFYTGLGWQWRSTTLEYDYLYEDGLIVNVESRFDKFKRNRFTYGPVAVVGFEYSYFTLPISAFIEIEWFTDTLLDPGYQRFQGGVGLRYVF
ncbi:MAG: hypothetical protein KDC93_07160 [Cyclobacteriaceae bacterium]|jgi:hypothetical protein|nr:hypothetical protein [Cyclobacteriaceae bacterium]